MHDVEHPLIAVNGFLEPGDPPRLTLKTPYADAVLKAGGVPVVVPAVGGPRDVARLLDKVGGLLLTGGDDFRMERIGRGATHPAAVPTSSEKQDYDFELVRAALERELPVLGICYGMQLLALAQGATLLQHLPEDRPSCRDHAGNAIHSVRVEPGTKLARILGVEELDVVSRHHQAIGEPGAGTQPSWRVSARDDEGLVEAVELEAHSFALGVQWHPELSSEGTPNDRLFQGLVGAAGNRAARALYPTH